MIVSVEKDLDSLSLTLLADFGAPIERVWQLWADPRQLERWWGPPSHPATMEKHDLAVGGEVAYVMTGPGGRGVPRLVARHVGRPAEIAGVHRRLGQPGRHAEPAAPTTAVQMRLSERDGGTRMELRFTFESQEHMDQLERRGAFDVFPQSVGQMDGILESNG